MSEKDKTFKIDLNKYYKIKYGTTNPSFAQKLAIWVTNFGLHCTANYRFGRYSKNLYATNKLIGLSFVLVYKFTNYLVRLIHHVDVGDANIGPGFYIGHVGTIYIGPTTIGRNFSVTHNVTIGVGHKLGVIGIPESFGDNVWIGTGSVISGSLKIGNNVTIVSGSILSKDIPDDCLVMGNPARVIAKEYDNSHLFGKIKGGDDVNKE